MPFKLYLYSVSPMKLPFTGRYIAQYGYSVLILNKPVFVRICVCMRMYVCECLYVCICMRVYMYVCIFFGGTKILSFNEVFNSLSLCFVYLVLFYKPF